MYDPDRYRDKAEIEQWKGHDPIPQMTERLTSSGSLGPGDLEKMEAEIESEIEDAVAFAESGTLEPVEDLERFVTSEPADTGTPTGTPP